MRPYEMMIILAPDIPEEELDPSIDTIESYVTNVDGNVIVISRESPWGRRRLAYPIRHQGRDLRDGFYTLWYFDAEPTAIAAIEREIRLNDRIIRHMIIALDEQVTLIPVEQRADESGEPQSGATDTGAATDVSPEAAPAAEAEAPAAEVEAPVEAEGPTETEAPAEADTAAIADVAPEAAAEDAPPADADADDDTTKE